MVSKIAIQGIQGSFHHQVATEYFQNEDRVIECDSFKKVMEMVSSGMATHGIIALENSIAGTILPNYALMDKYNTFIVGEHYVNINMNLLALKGQKIEDLTEVHSHPIALLQCADFFDAYPNIKLVESSDTANAAKKIKENQLNGIGALAGDIAAEMYKLEILKPSVHTVKSNKTRFVVLEAKKDRKVEDKINKASLKFELDDTPGNLATVLNVINNCKLNLTKIQSLPIIEKPFSYSFFIDVVFEKRKHYEKAKSLLEIMTLDFKVLGEYQSGNQN